MPPKPRNSQRTSSPFVRDRRANETSASGLPALSLQHEIDHLDGKLFLDYLSVLKRTAALTKWKMHQDRYPGFIRRTALETPEEREHHRHPEEEL